ncbi:hypothetical protein ACFQ0T_14150 [Kitasatospora gansuensis]
MILRPAEYQDHAERHLDELHAFDTPPAVHPAGHPTTTEATVMNDLPAPGTKLSTHLHGLPGLGPWTVSGMATVLETGGRTVLLSIRSRGAAHVYATGTLSPASAADARRGIGWTVTDLVTTGIRPTHLTLAADGSQFGTPDVIERAASTALDALAPHLAAATATGPLSAEHLPAAATSAATTHSSETSPPPPSATGTG